MQLSYCYDMERNTDKMFSIDEYHNHSVNSNYYFLQHTILHSLVVDLGLSIPHQTEPNKASSIKKHSYLPINSANKLTELHLLMQPYSWNTNSLSHLEKVVSCFPSLGVEGNLYLPLLWLLHYHSLFYMPSCSVNYDLLKMGEDVLIVSEVPNATK